QQVIVNLLNNARDAVADVPQPEITLKLSGCTVDKHFREKYPELLSNELVCLSVKDNGSGIAKDHLNHLFEPFFTTKEAGKGTGLGLAMCYGALQSHQGVINVKSKMGVGSTFYIYLPLIENDSASKDNLTEVEVKSANGETILIADDELHVRETTTEVLESMGYRVLQAKDGLEAVELFKAHRNVISLAILDVVMPHLGGATLAKHLRDIAPDLPLIFVTGYDKDHVLGGSEHIHHSETFTKPVNFNILNQSIRKLLG
ncbi:MAG: ATP-binding protein, partial [Mariprofundus sp.]